MLNTVSKFYGGLRLARNPKPVCKITINFDEIQTTFENRKIFINYVRKIIIFGISNFLKIKK